VSPAWRRDDFADDTACFLGVSLENKNFASAKVRGMTEWIARRFSRCAVLVGDSIHRINLEIRGYSPPDALAEAHRLGVEFIENNSQNLHDPAGLTEFEFITCSQVQQFDDYAQYHAALVWLFEHDREFRSSVETFSHAYHTRRPGSLAGMHRLRNQRRSCDYFLEEFAIFCCLQQRGLDVMVYPGSFSTLSEITDGRHPKAPAELRELVVVSLQLKGR